MQVGPPSAKVQEATLTLWRSAVQKAPRSAHRMEPAVLERTGVVWPPAPPSAVAADSVSVPWPYAVAPQAPEPASNAQTSASVKRNASRSNQVQHPFRDNWTAKSSSVLSVNTVERSALAIPSNCNVTQTSKERSLSPLSSICPET